LAAPSKKILGFWVSVAGNSFAAKESAMKRREFLKHTGITSFPLPSGHSLFAKLLPLRLCRRQPSMLHGQFLWDGDVKDFFKHESLFA
jgi:hypothetical protein